MKFLQRSDTRFLQRCDMRFLKRRGMRFLQTWFKKAAESDLTGLCHNRNGPHHDEFEPV